MAEATCRRELDLEIPADEVTKAMERVAKEFARVARVPGFRPGKAPVSLIRRRFADDIKGEVVQSLVPERVEKASKNLPPFPSPRSISSISRKASPSSSVPSSKFFPNSSSPIIKTSISKCPCWTSPTTMSTKPSRK